MDVDGMLADPLVYAAVGVGAGPRPAEHLAVIDRHDERPAIFDPALDVLGRPKPGLERRDTLGDAGVVDLGHAFKVAGLGGANGQLVAEHCHERSLRARMIAAPACSCTRWVSVISTSANPAFSSAE